MQGLFLAQAHCMSNKRQQRPSAVGSGSRPAGRDSAAAAAATRRRWWRRHNSGGSTTTAAAAAVEAAGSGGSGSGGSGSGGSSSGDSSSSSNRPAATAARGDSSHSDKIYANSQALAQCQQWCFAIRMRTFIPVNQAPCSRPVQAPPRKGQINSELASKIPMRNHST